jgi:hypothetical protein
MFECQIAGFWSQYDGFLPYYVLGVGAIMMGFMSYCWVLEGVIMKIVMPSSSR